jgi:membrane-bound lytic murein transglycosylase D
MPETAKILGLKVTARADERKNYTKSTRAAAKYLRDLHNEFGDWLLVIAAYNGGEGSVYAAIRESGSRNYWVLQPFLPLETRLYVKKFIATCYYFEGSGGLVELSKKTEPDHKKIQQNLAAARGKSKPEQPSIRIGYESPDDKFNRLMKQSEQSLQRSTKVLEGSR